MLDGDFSLNDLLDALQYSPDNIPLRKQVLKLLFKNKNFEKAEKIAKEGLTLNPDYQDFKYILAETYYRLGKNSAALVVVEDLCSTENAPGEAYLLHARLLLKGNDVEGAKYYYHKALAIHPEMEDAELETLLDKAANPELGDFSEKVPVMDYLDDDADFDDFAELEKPGIDFSDVGGMEKVKEEIEMKIIHPLKNQELYKAYGKKVGGGILLYGPPGCGKTHLARATAGEVDANFLSVGINEILDMWMGNSEKRLHEVFQLARSKQPTVMFFDEVDAIGANRTDMRKNAGRTLINQFLAELDGDRFSNDGVLILAATNTPWNMDAAFRRPGRFDRIILVTPPDEPARASILEILLRDKPFEKLDLSAIAKKTKDFSGADLKALVEVAVEGKLRESLKTGKPMPITQKDLLEASKKIKPSTKEWFATAKNYALYANEGGLYDDVLEYLKMK